MPKLRLYIAFTLHILITIAFLPFIPLGLMLFLVAKLGNSLESCGSKIEKGYWLCIGAMVKLLDYRWQIFDKITGESTTGQEER